ncbi:hypothetical protein THAOC_23278 [Thalassiosira oceanica]|uniref:Uncharacterized protein n=1 Tax=Thalassiosira oceanica TaxID=159749 RepID=K0RWG9_THAOC|nr:hypothetical protein THAOC_23278 [Thalassiosira oceanica]|eukprot:EJK56769.1 hypothetical protein THAOC_23278 [Thalassiosira oceanica]
MDRPPRPGGRRQRATTVLAVGPTQFLSNMQGFANSQCKPSHRQEELRSVPLRHQTETRAARPGGRAERNVSSAAGFSKRFDFGKPFLDADLSCITPDYSSRLSRPPLFDWGLGALSTSKAEGLPFASCE